MNASQAHRGPDGSGIYEDPTAGIGLGHARLAILDLSDNASQPMVSADGRYVLVFNGEIYNYRELRRGIGGPVNRRRSSGDTDVLLEGLAKYGSEFIHRLNGMFAFALWDSRQQQLLLARDHLGIKPLYYAQPTPGTLLFASEIKALCAHPALRREPDFVALQQHLAFCHASGDRTMLKHVKRLPPASTLRWSNAEKRPSISRFWQPTFSTHPPENRDAAVEELRETTRQAVKRQLVSDVSVGSFLSGGLDSSLITALAAGERGPQFEAYTIGYPATENTLDQMAPDAPHARRLAQDLQLAFHEIEVGSGVTSTLPKLIHHLDEPLADPAAVTCYLISKLARSHGTKVLLSGQGADELFGGYPRYWAMQHYRQLDRLPNLAKQMIAQTSRVLPGAWSGRLGALARRGRRALVELAKPPGERFLALCTSTPAEEIRSVLSPALAAELDGASPAAQCQAWTRSSNLGAPDSFLARDLSVYLPNHNLLYTDKMGMAVGLEARVPLLDLELVELATRFPYEWKVGRKTLKVILRESARGCVPDDIIDRPKAGFGAPYRKWLRHDLGEMWHDLTSAATVLDRGWFEPEALAAARRRSQSGSMDLYMLQWAVLTTELWARQFIDQNPADVTKEQGRGTRAPYPQTASPAA